MTTTSTGLRQGAKLLVVTSMAVFCMLAACGSQTNDAPPTASVPTSSQVTTQETLGDTEVTDAIVDEFMLLAGVPRPSHHEDKISAFLMGWAQEQGLSPVQDDSLNVMFDIPATKGMEDKPLVILQGHMDMVAVAEDGRQFDPVKDPISVIRNDAEGTLTADGTSLGADDGVGVSFIMAVAQGKMAHGPLRALITTDEEDGMEGAFGMDPSWLDGASYLINIDNEVSNQVLVSTAAGDAVSMTKKTEFVAPTGNTSLTIELSGLKGGHSGVEIDKGRMNANVGLAGLLRQLDESGIGFELASFDGGTAGNAIPPKAKAVIVVDASVVPSVEQEAQAWLAKATREYEGVEDGMSCTVTESEDLAKVVSAADRDALVKLALEAIDGVHTMSAEKSDLVESSSNLGILKLDEGGMQALAFVRSSVANKESEIVDSHMTLAQELGCEVEVTHTADAWPYDPNSKLTELAKQVYQRLNGEPIEVAAVHAGVECGTFKAAKPDLDLISIGPDLENVHTPKEVLHLDSIPKTWRLLEGILAEVA